MDLCNENLLSIYELFSLVLYILKWFIPMLIIIKGTFDLFQAVIKNEESILKKRAMVLMKRIIAGVLIFFIPNFILLIFDTLLPQENNYSCAYECVLDRKCDSIGDNSNSSSNNSSSDNTNSCSNMSEEQCNQNIKCMWVDMTRYGNQFNNPQTNNYYCAIK